MNTARLGILIVGVLLPYMARIPGGSAWLEQYTRTGVDGVLLLQVCNAVAWGGLLALSFCIRRPAMLLIPCVLGFGYLAWAHASLDLAADAQSGIALVLIPIYALLPIGIGGLVGYVLDRRFAGHGAAE